MKFLFVSPALGEGSRGYFDSRYVSFMMGTLRRSAPFLSLPTVAALCPPGSDIRIVDEYVEPVPFDDEFDVVGVTTNTVLSRRAYEIADAFRARGRTVVIGGIHASLVPEEAARHADSVVVGEAETSFPALLDDLNRGELKPVYRSDEYEDLSNSVVPRWDLVPLEFYGKPVIQSSRGCPHDCEFCSVRAFFGRKYRWKPIGLVEKELEILKALGRKMFFWADDNLTANRKRALEVLKRMEPLGMHFLAQVPLQIAYDPELLKALAAAGCQRVVIGFESLSEKNLRQMKKGRGGSAAAYADSIRRIQSTGIEVEGSFILGYDDDDASIFKKTADFIVENAICMPIVSILTPFPGTRLYERLENEGRITTKDWTLYDGTHACFRPTGMSVRELEEGYEQVRQAVYSYDSIFRRLESIWGLWNENGVRIGDRLATVVLNLDGRGAVYGVPDETGFAQADVQLHKSLCNS